MFVILSSKIDDDDKNLLKSFIRIKMISIINVVYKKR